MPIYCYKTEDGEVVERVFAMKDVEETIVLEDGRTATRDFKAEHNYGGVGTGGNYPRNSSALGVHPRQVKDFEKHSREYGVPTHFTKGGEAILTDKAHERKYSRLRRCYQNNAGHGDATPNDPVPTKTVQKKKFF